MAQNDSKTYLKKLLRTPLERSFCIAVDGGYLACVKKLKRIPDLSIGDWDSFKNGHSKAESRTVITLATQKDKSDLALALDEVRNEFQERNGITIEALGFVGGRLDHQLAVLQDCSHFMVQTRGARVWLRSVKQDISFVTQRNPSLKLSLLPGQSVSILSMTAVCRGVHLYGFYYPVRDGILKSGSHGLSNVVRLKRQEIHLRTGVSVVIVNNRHV